MFKKWFKEVIAQPWSQKIDSEVSLESATELHKNIEGKFKNLSINVTLKNLKILLKPQK